MIEQTNKIDIFDRLKLRRQSNRAADQFRSYDILFRETSDVVVERVRDVKRSFKAILDLGSHQGLLAEHFQRQKDAFVVATDCAERMTNPDLVPSLVCDEDYLPFAPKSFDLVVSNLSLHWVNDLPGALLQIRNVLHHSGLFIASMIGGDTLYELRLCLMDAELAVMGGVSPRLSPTISLHVATALLQRAGFELPVVDKETYTFLYPDALALMRDLRGMGATNAHLERLRYPTRREVFLEAARLYQERFSDASGSISARFEVIFLHGWAEDQGQKKP